MTDYKFGDIVLVPFPFTDQSTSKKRPAVIISSNTYNQKRPDIVIMAVTSQSHGSGYFGDVRIHKMKINDTESFGDRMARFRSEAGYSQRELARETGISQRMIAYYEKQAKYPPTHLLPTLAKARGTSADELLGSKQQMKKSIKRICGSGGDSAR